MNKQKIVDVLLRAKREGVQVSLDNNQLVFKVEKGRDISKELISELKNTKAYILQFLQEEKTKKSFINSDKFEIKPIDRHEYDKIPLSYSQRSAWLQDKIKGNKINLASSVFRLVGALNKEDLIQTIYQIVKRHESLRTLIRVDKDGIPYQHIEPIEKWTMSIVDQLPLNIDFTSYLDKLSNVNFDLATDFPFKVALFRVSNNEHVLFLLFHHICTDEVSEKIFLRELLEIYQAKATGVKPRLQENKIQYADYAVWQNIFLNSEIYKNKLNYWKEQLKNTPSVKFPYDNIEHTSGNKARDKFIFFSKEFSEKINKYSHANEITSYMFFLSVFKLLIYKYTNQNDICIGTPVANRMQNEIQNTIGYFVNTIAIRTTIDSNSTFEQVLRTVKETVLNAFSNQEVPFEEILDSLKLERFQGENPIYNIVFNYLNKTPESGGDNYVLDGLEVIAENSIKYKEAEFDMLLSVMEDVNGYTFAMRYNTDFYTKETVEQLCESYEQLILNILYTKEIPIKEIDVLRKDLIENIIQKVKSNKQTYSKDKTILDFFKKRVTMHPDRVAVVFENNELNYRELDEMSSQFANYIKAEGIEKGDLLPLKIDRSLEMLVSLIGILKTGAAYVAIPTEFPIDRTKFIIEEIRPKFFIVDNSNDLEFSSSSGYKVLMEKIFEEITSQNTYFKEVVSAETLSYVVYTSGTSGTPKAVMTDHGNLLSFMHSVVKFLEINEKSHFLGLASYGFDGSCLELYLPLMYGSRVTIVPKNTIRDGVRLNRLIESSSITHIHATPSGFQLLIDAGWKNSGNATLISGGESINYILKNKLIDFSNAPVWNFYGPTETTLYATCKLLKREDEITVGKPLPNYEIYIVNNDFNLLPEGVDGEILIGGLGVAKGYFQREELTAKKFIDNPFNKEKGTKLYRTGDKGSWTSDGEIIVKGRIDNQIKLRGYRIELDEINLVISKFEAVISSCVLFDEGSSSETQKIIAFVTSKENFKSGNLRAYLNTKLPAYMIPSAIVVVSQFPLSRNGKIDKKALLQMNGRKNLIKKDDKLETETERKLLKIWKDILKTEEINVTDDFFLLGGNSLSAVRLIARIMTHFDIELPVKLIFEYPTIQSLANHLKNGEEGRDGQIAKIQVKGELTPIFCPAAVGGNPLEYDDLSKSLGNNQPFYGFFHRGLDGKKNPFTTVEEMALNFINEALEVHPTGPFIIGGFSFGGKIAFEMAHQLEKKGHQVERLIILDSFAPDSSNVDPSEIYNMKYVDWVLFFARLYNEHIAIVSDDRISVDMDEMINLKSREDQLRCFHNKLKNVGSDYTFEQLKGHLDVYINNSLMGYNALRKRIKAPILLVKCLLDHQSLFTPDLDNKIDDFYKIKSLQNDYGWKIFTEGKVEIFEIETTHMNLLKKPSVDKVSEIIRGIINRRVL